MKLDTRHILTRNNGFYIRPVEYERGSSLCEFCSISAECREPNKKRERCDLFVMALSFSPEALKGLSGTFSTYRSSQIWYERALTSIHNGGKVGLFDTKTQKRLGFATITKAHLGRFEDLMLDHAGTNHLSLAAGIPHEQAITWLPKQIRNLAGSRYVKTPDQISTVIYVQTEENAERERETA